MSSDDLSHSERRRLLGIARDAIDARLRGFPPYDPDADSTPTGILASESGAFVSLHTGRGMLRGCIGCFTGSGPLTQTVTSMAVSAAVHDPRFPSLEADELRDVEIEISVLSPLRPVADIDAIEPGRHGIQISRGQRRGVLLPQVATKYGWDCERFLAETCRKAGLPLDAWRDADTTIQTFTADVFSESEVLAHGDD
jgi:AmmeMemoRadiSam system protein A